MKKKSEKTHIEEVGETKYWRAYDRAMMRVRLDAPKLVGLNKIRAAIAHEAALQATGFDARPFAIPKHGCGEPTVEMQEIVDAIFPLALDDARRAVAQDAVQ